MFDRGTSGYGRISGDLTSHTREFAAVTLSQSEFHIAVRHPTGTALNMTRTLGLSCP